MSIQDDYFDIQHILKKQSRGTKKTFERFSRWAFDLEETVDMICNELKNTKITIKTMMGISCPNIKIGYKLFRQRKNDSLGSLFINRSEHLPLGVWMLAEGHRTKGYAYRPGWHVLLKPNAPHLKTYPKNEKRIWAKVAVIDYETHVRPESQGGKWLLAQKMLILETI